MDLRGTGRADPLPAGYSTADHAAGVGAVVEAAGRGPVTAMGVGDLDRAMAHFVEDSSDRGGAAEPEGDGIARPAGPPREATTP
jgi:hypothetical protein